MTFVLLLFVLNKGSMLFKVVSMLYMLEEIVAELALMFNKFDVIAAVFVMIEFDRALMRAGFVLTNEMDDKLASRLAI